MSNQEECCDKSENPKHSKEIANLNRVIGQLEGIKKMINENRYCPDIITQLMASRSAIRSISGNVLKRHIHSCVVDAFMSEEEKDKKIDEIRDLFGKFE